MQLSLSWQQLTSVCSWSWRWRKATTRNSRRRRRRHNPPLRWEIGSGKKEWYLLGRCGGLVRVSQVKIRILLSTLYSLLSTLLNSIFNLVNLVYYTDAYYCLYPFSLKFNAFYIATCDKHNSLMRFYFFSFFSWLMPFGV